MFSFRVAGLLAAVIGFAAAQESHQVIMTNRCGSGSPVFLYEDNLTPQGSTTVSGQLRGGIAWLDGFNGPAGTCLSSGVHCGAVEFTLRNDAPNQNAADFTLEGRPEEGNHVFTYPMSWNFFGECSVSDHCPSADNCPNAFTNPTNGKPLQCTAPNVGINIVFC